MKKYNVVTSTEKANATTNNIWEGDTFPDPIEAESENEAIEIAIDYIMDNSNWELVDTDRENVSADYQNGWITYTDNKDNEYTIFFRTEEEI